MKKVPKLRKSSSMETSTGDESIKDEIIDIVKQNQKRIFLLIKEITSFFKLHIDTYLVCIKIANMLKFDGDSNLCKQVAAVICYLVQKSH